MCKYGVIPIISLVLLALVVAAEIILGMWSLIRGALFLSSKLNELVVSEMDNKRVRLLILIPCLNEQKSIVATLEYFSSIFPNDWCDVAIVTTAVEKRDDAYGKTTHDVVKHYLAKTGSTGIILCHYPFSEGFMAHQLNYAINQIGISQYDYIAVYNADSRPSPLTYHTFLCKALEGTPVIQGYSAMTANYDSLSSLMKAFAVYQTNYEIKTGFLGSMMPSVFCSPHVVGHGLFIKTETLTELGLFNTDCWCEDIFMTIQLHNKGIDIEALPVLEEADAPATLRSQLIQYSTWAKTALSVGPLFRKQCHDLTLRGRWQLLQRDLRSFAWLISSPLIAISFFLGFILFGPSGLQITLVSFLFMCASEYGMTILLICGLGIHKKKRYLYIGFVLTPIVRLLASLGPMMSFFARTKRATPR